MIGYATRMAAPTLQILPCPLERVAEALSLALSELAPSLRREAAGASWPRSGAASPPVQGLFVALRGERLCGATWAQRQPGNIAMFWRPQLVVVEPISTARRLAVAALQELDDAGIVMSQVLMPSHDAEGAPLLKSVGFRHLADLLYLACEAERFPSRTPAPPELEFVPYDESQLRRLATLIERTYDGTLDCAALNGTRRMEDVVAGYQSTGVFRPENWLMVRHADQDVGVLLLADHPAARHWELVYMGLVPEVRGCGLGRQIALHAQSLAQAAKVERIVVAVDAANRPALRMYRSTGFESWDRRAVLVRFSANSQT